MCLGAFFGGLRKVETVPFVSVLSKAGITSSTSNSYTLSTINSAISTALNNKKVEILCAYDKPVGSFIKILFYERKC